MKRSGTGRSRGPRRYRIAPLPILATLILTAGCGSTFSTLHPVSSQGSTIYHEFVVISILSGIVTLIVFGLLGWILLKYRGHSGDDEPEQTSGSKMLEITWISIPVVILIGLFIYSTFTMRSVDARSSATPSRSTSSVINGGGNTSIRVWGLTPRVSFISRSDNRFGSISRPPTLFIASGSPILAGSRTPSPVRPTT